MSNRWIVVAMCTVAALCAEACSSSSKSTAPAATQTMQSPADKNNPAAKYLELAGFRMREKSPGKLAVAFAVINHSEADLGDLSLVVNIRTTAAKPDDPPLLTFTAKVTSLGPQEIKDVTTIVPTKLRVYELPDWQFVRSDFRVAEPK